ncbi:hypothetical protein RUM43_011085 [Polyplax serrata]|uniref:Uncharacterized protein n=1 Tax=Polyplax serrata TaxID=468196 RepID=A0AAN8NSF1_POLSC
MMESHHYNTYSSAKYSNDKRTLYLALNKKGIPRKVQTKAKASLGKLETYTNVLPRPVSPDRVETLAMNIAKARILLGKFLGSGEDGLGTNHLFRHHRYQFCPNVPMTKLDEKNKFRCRKREKRKKKKKCREDEDDDEECVTAAPKKKIQGKCDEDEDEQECLRRLHVVRQKRKSRNGSEADTNAKCSGGKCADDKEKKRKKRLKMEKKKFGSNEKTVKYKCGSDVNCNKKKGVTKGPRKKKGKTESQSGEESVTFSLLWREIVEETKSTDMVDIFASQSSLASVESPTEKPLDNYDEEDQTEKFLDDEEETSAEMGYEWATQSFTLPVPSSTSGSEFASASASVSASSSSSTFDD